MTFNVFITQPEMEEQGKSVFREDGWLPTIFILKAHHLFSDGFGIRGSLPAPRLPASLSAVEQEGRSTQRRPAQNGNPNVVGS